jgi:chaperone LolA
MLLRFTITTGLLILSQAAWTASLKTYLGNVKSITANFEQRVQSETADKKNLSYGSLVVQSPNKFRLEYTKPYKQIYVADGKRLWSYDEDLEQVTVKSQANMLTNTPAMVLSNPAELDKAYKVKPQGVADGVEWFQLTPLQTDSGFDSVRLGFVERKLRYFEMQDSFGQKTQLNFNDLQYNPVLQKNSFVFTPPAGVDVIDDTEIDTQHPTKKQDG